MKHHPQQQQQHHQRDGSSLPKADPWVVRKSKPKNLPTKSVSAHKVAVAAKRARSDAKRTLIQSIPVVAAKPLMARRSSSSSASAVAAATVVIDLTEDEEKPTTTTAAAPVVKEKSAFVDLRPTNDDNAKPKAISDDLTLRHFNVSAGGSHYEKAASRHKRHRLALLSQHDNTSRDEAIPLSRGGARGPGSASLPVPEYGNDAEYHPAKPIRHGRHASRQRSHHQPNGSDLVLCKDSYAPLMAGQVLPLKKKAANKKKNANTQTARTGMNQGRERLMGRIDEKERRR